MRKEREKIKKDGEEGGRGWRKERYQKEKVKEE